MQKEMQKEEMQKGAGLSITQFHLHPRSAGAYSGTIPIHHMILSPISKS